MDVIEAEWLRVTKHPEVYEASLRSLEYNQTRSFAELDTEFFQQFEMPVHPKYVVEKLQEMRFSSQSQSLLHVAMGVHRANSYMKCDMGLAFPSNASQQSSSTFSMGLKFIESMVKNRFSLFVTDKDGRTPLGFLLAQSVSEDAILPVIKIVMRYGEAKSQITLITKDLFMSGKITIRMFKLLEPQLRTLPLEENKTLHADIYKLEVSIPKNVLKALDNILLFKLRQDLRKRKVPAMLLYQAKLKKILAVPVYREVIKYL